MTFRTLTHLKYKTIITSSKERHPVMSCMSSPEMASRHSTQGTQQRQRSCHLFTFSHHTAYLVRLSSSITRSYHKIVKKINRNKSILTMRLLMSTVHLFAQSPPLLCVCALSFKGTTDLSGGHG